MLWQDINQIPRVTIHLQPSVLHRSAGLSGQRATTLARWPRRGCDPSAKSLEWERLRIRAHQNFPVWGLLEIDVQISHLYSTPRGKRSSSLHPTQLTTAGCRLWLSQFRIVVWTAEAIISRCFHHLCEIDCLRLRPSSDGAVCASCAAYRQSKPWTKLLNRDLRATEIPTGISVLFRCTNHAVALASKTNYYSDSFERST